ncbi:MAG: hypothetical protein ACRC14_16855 [Paracoccaceae bacterium]
MFGLFKRKPPPDPELTGRIKHWVSALMNLSDADTIMVAELACRDPGCVDLETVVTVIRADRRQFVLRFPGPLADVTEAEVQSLGPKSDRA